ncbi:MAG: FAD:protein FMN transferase [Muribaculaceae bacterium]|nr:FAD:protein FMN transferase [Muribaculaceae bacterium]
MTNRKFLSALLLTSIIAFLTSCDHSKWNKSEGMVWHTSYHITWCGPAELADSIMPVLMEVDAAVNAFNDNSLVSRINRETEGIVDKHFETLHSESMRVHKLSEGAFDPTLGPLITAWGFGRGHQASADTLKLDSLLNLTGIQRTRISDGRLIKPVSGMQFNFSAIAKGYGCDCVGEMFRRNGVTDYMVEIGGEIACRGKSPSGSKWRISIDKPVISDGIIHESQCVIALDSAGVATSGNYRNYHAATSGGGKYGHTISAVTGRPIATDVLSATVVAPNAMEADALATAFMAMPTDDALKLAGRLEYPVMLVLKDSVFMTPQFHLLIVNQ